MPKIPFNKLDKNHQLLLSSLPMLVYVTKNPDNETENQIIETHDRFLKLSEDIKNKLASLETSRRIQDIRKRFQLSLFQMASIARLVRSYYFREVKIENFASVLSEKLKIDQMKAQEISKHITEKIINQKSRSQGGAGDKTIEKLPILEALKKYPRVGEQLVTANHIKIGNNSESVRPSIRNWIMDYRFVKGNNVYEDLERGNYLFHGKNTAKLTLPERQKLSLILKSLDNNISLSVDTQRQQIVFSQTTTSAGQKADAVKKPPTKTDRNEIKEHWQKTTSERERNGGQSISKETLRQFQPQSAAKPPLGSVRDFYFSSPQKFESEEKADLKNLKRVAEAKTSPPLENASNDLDAIHSVLTEQIKKTKEKKSAKPRKYQIYPMGVENDNKKDKSRAKGNIVNLKEDF